MPNITSIVGRLVYNSRGSQTIEVDVTVDHIHTGRVSAPSGASVGIHEASSFPKGGASASLRILEENKEKILGSDPTDIKSTHKIIKEIDPELGYPTMGGSLAFALSIAAAESAAKYNRQPLYQFLREQLVNTTSTMQTAKISSSTKPYKFPFPLGNILGGGAHAGPGTPDIQEILICAIGAKTIQDAIRTNLDVHAELRCVLQLKDVNFSGGKGDEGGWAPKLDNEGALQLAAKACENLGFTLGKEVALGVDFASSTQWNVKKSKYVYDRAGFENDHGEQLEFVSDIISRYNLIYAEDTVHEEAFEEMAQIMSRFPDVLITGDDLTVTNTDILKKAIDAKSCNAAILKVNQAGGLYDALEFATLATQNNKSLITSHRSGESVDSHISHIGIATGSKMLKVGIVGGERVAKINELLRIDQMNGTKYDSNDKEKKHNSKQDVQQQHDLIQGMAEL